MSKKAWRQAYVQIVVAWMTEMRLAAKAEEKARPKQQAQRYEAWPSANV
jgi:hypothetical protein